MIQPQKSHTSFIEYLSEENYYLNKKYNDLFKFVETLQSSLHYTNHFIRSTYDLSGHFLANIKIVSYDSSNNILSSICADASGYFYPSFVMIDDISKNHHYKMHHIDVSYNINKESTIDVEEKNLKNTIVHTNEHIKTGEEQTSDTDKGFGHWGHWGHGGYWGGGFGPYYPYYPYPLYPYPYPYLYHNLLSDDDMENRAVDISYNHPIHTPPIQYPIIYPPQKPPVIHRDILDNPIEMYDTSKETYYINPLHTSIKNNNKNHKIHGISEEFFSNPLHKYVKKNE